jgi:septum site-determining protein MinC
MGILGMTDNSLKSQSFKLKGRLYTFTVIQLLSTDNSLFSHQLTDVIAKAPRLFENIPVVLDCNAVAAEEIDLSTILTAMRTHNMHLVAIQSTNSKVCLQAKAQGIALLNASSANDKSLADNLVTDDVTAVTLQHTKTKLITTPVRSGQQVVSKGGDLVIISSVSHGSELLADGHIHVYGALRGRALAGISGDRSARIFCHSLEAELVSIAGFYRLSDAIEQRMGGCQIYLQGDTIQIAPL